MKKENVIRKIIVIINEWQKDLSDNTRLERLKNSFMEAKKLSEIDQIIEDNVNFIDKFPCLWKLANRSKQRIKIQHEIKWKLTEKIYLN